MAGNSTEHGRSVTSKVVAILMTFTDCEAHTLSEVARSAGLPTSTTHRLILELAAWGLLERTDDLQYCVGESLRGLGTRTGRVPNLQERARRVMEDLSLATGADVRLGVLADAAVSYIEKRPRNPVSAFSESTTLPAHATAMGKALLAFSPPGTLEQITARGLKQYTPHTLITVDTLRSAIANTKLSRVAVSRWEFTIGLSTVAVPVFGAGGAVTAALELTAHDLRADLHRLHAPLVVAARGLSRELTTGQRHGAPLIGGQWLPAVRAAAEAAAVGAN